MTAGEIAIMLEIPSSRMTPLLNSLIKLGLFKTISASKEYYEALPPYAAFNANLQNFSNMLEIHLILK